MMHKILPKIRESKEFFNMFYQQIRTPPLPSFLTISGSRRRYSRSVFAVFNSVTVGPHQTLPDWAENIFGDTDDYISEVV